MCVYARVCVCVRVCLRIYVCMCVCDFFVTVCVVHIHEYSGACACSSISISRARYWVFSFVVLYFIFWTMSLTAPEVGRLGLGWLVTTPQDLCVSTPQVLDLQAHT